MHDGRMMLDVISLARLRRVVCGTVLALAGLLGTTIGAAQVPDTSAAARAASERLGRPVSNREILDAIRRSGLSQQEIRARLQARGLDPSLTDPFFRPGGVDTLAMAFASARALLDVVGAETLPSSLERDVTGLDSGWPAAGAPGEEAAAYAGRVFGKAVFNAAAAAFTPVTAGPVDPSYRLAPGDQVQLVLTGDVERVQNLEVRRDGTVLVSQVGQVPVAGLTFEAARTVLRQHAQRAFSGLATGAVQLDLSLTRSRTSQVFVIGEVERPGAYQVSAFATVFHAIARAGGPTERGSFRRIELRRGGQLVQEIDLYSYLLRGDATQDRRVEQGDVIYVPVNTRAVEVRGAVRRPAVFELKEGEGFGALLAMAGGLLPTASTERLQVDRILPADQRQPGIERVVVDVPFGGRSSALDSVPLVDGDIVTVFTIGRLRRNSVELRGEVYQPGTYEFRPGLTLGALLEQAQGLLPWALRDRVQITRPIPETGRSRFIEVSLAAGGDTTSLAEFDEVTVLDGRLLHPSGLVTVSGAVNAPGEFPFVEGQTLKGLIDRVGGFLESATSVEVARRQVSADYTDTTSTIYRFPVDSLFGRAGPSAGFVLEREDRMFVRSAPGFRDQRAVLVTGLFRYPGSYVLATDQTRLADVIARAGGLLPSASPDAFRLIRKARPVAIDLRKALAGDSTHNVTLQAGDQLTVGSYEPTVLVRGAVQRSALILYEEGRSFSDYIKAAGGGTDNADMKRATIEYANGEVATRSKTLLVFRKEPEVRPGSIISVPVKPADVRPSSFPQTLGIIVQATTAVLSLVLGYIAVTK